MAGETKPTGKSITEIIEQLLKEKGGAGAAGAGDSPGIELTKIGGDLGRVRNDLKKVATGFLSDLIKFQTRLHSDTASLGSMWKSTSELLKNLATGNIKEATKSAGTLAQSSGQVALILTAAAVSMAGRMAVAMTSAATYMSQRLNGAWGGVEAAMTSVTKIGSDVLKLIPIVGDGLSAMFDTITTGFIKAMMFSYEDALSRNKVSYAIQAQLGAGKTTGMESDVIGLWSRLGRDVAGQWGAAAVSAGVTKQGVVREMAFIGKAQSMEAGAVAAELEKTLVLEQNAVTATQMLSDNFRVMQATAEGTNLPVKLLAKNVLDAAVGARFMNVDLKTVQKTMDLLVDNADRLKSVGIDLRMDSQGIMADFTNSNKRISDGLFSVIGTKMGETDPIKAMYRAKYGKTFTDTLQYHAETKSFSAASKPSGETTIESLTILKEMAAESAAGSSTETERLTKIVGFFRDVRGMSEEGALAAAMLPVSDLMKAMKDPAKAAQFGDKDSVFRALQTSASHSENIQRELMKINMEMLLVAIDMLKLTQVSAGTLMNIALGRTPKTGEQASAQKVIDTTGKSIDNIMKSFEIMKNEMGVYFPQEVMDRYNAGNPKLPKHTPEKKITLDMSKETDPVLRAMGGQELTGGQVYPSQTGRNVYSVAEDGRPELYHSGGGSNILFAPGASGRIFNASETMGAFNKGLGGGSSAPTVARSGNDERTVLNITINAGTLDKASFAKLLETEVLNHIYR